MLTVFLLLHNLVQCHGKIQQINKNGTKSFVPLYAVQTLWSHLSCSAVYLFYDTLGRSIRWIINLRNLGSMTSLKKCKCFCASQFNGFKWNVLIGPLTELYWPKPLILTNINIWFGKKKKLLKMVKNKISQWENRKWNLLLQWSNRKLIEGNAKKKQEEVDRQSPTAGSRIHRAFSRLSWGGK